VFVCCAKVVANGNVCDPIHTDGYLLALVVSAHEEFCPVDGYGKYDVDAVEEVCWKEFASKHFAKVSAHAWSVAVLYAVNEFGIFAVSAIEEPRGESAIGIVSQ
jgi:hypothetical protein